MEKNRTQFPFTMALRSNKLTSHDHNNKNKHYDRPAGGQTTDSKKKKIANGRKIEEKKYPIWYLFQSGRFCCFIVGV